MNTKLIRLLKVISLVLYLNSYSQTWPILQANDPGNYFKHNCTLGEIHGNHFHEGIDIDCSSNVPIRPIDDGIVRNIIPQPQWYDIEIGHNYVNGIPQRISTYRELSCIGNLIVGNDVFSGITILGNTGNHLHLEMRIRTGNEYVIINPVSNNSGWQLNLPEGHPDTYPPQINDILVEELNNQSNNVQSGFTVLDPNNNHGVTKFPNTAGPHRKVHVANTQYGCTFSIGPVYNFQEEKLVIWGNVSFIINARDIGINYAPGNGTGGATPEMGAINIMNGNVGIGTNTPSKALDVTGDIKFSGDLYKNDQLLDLNTWGKNGSNIYYNQGNVGIGITSPAANLHIVSDIGDTDAEFLKIQNTGTGVLGSGTTIIGKQVGGGPIIVQQAGNSSFSNQGSTLSFIQKSANNQVGLNISTFTFTNGSVKESNICAPDCALTVGAKENLNLRSQNGDIKFYANAPLIDDALLAMTINNAGQVGIGTETHIDNFTRLTVAGRIHAQEVKVTANAGADFVFGKDYDLPGIAETADFIKVNQHLPGIPSAAEMQ